MGHVPNATEEAPSAAFSITDPRHEEHSMYELFLCKVAPPHHRGVATLMSSCVYASLCLRARELTNDSLLLVWYQDKLDKQHGDYSHGYTDKQCPPPWNVVKVQH